MSRRLLMSEPFSIYLDCVRVLAALLVVFTHFKGHGLTPSAVFMDDLGHEAVMVFFVLSGIVIRSTMADSLQKFARARATRLYSVVLPCIVLSYASAYWLAREGGSDAWTFFRSSGGVTNFLTSLTFLNESWVWNDLPANGPFWSLCYEASYYALFGAWAYLEGRRRIVVCFIIAVIIGPGILALMPIWWAGVWFAERQNRFVASRAAGWTMLIGGMVGALAINYFQVAPLMKGVTHRIVPGLWHLRHAELFVTDYVVACCVLLHFIGFKVLEPHLAAAMAKIKPAARWLSGSTFSIYLFHYPIMLLVASAIGIVHSWASCIALYAGVVGLCVLLSYVSERQKERFGRIMMVTRAV